MAVSRERLDALYNELFGRTTGAGDEGAQYWMESGLSGEALRDALIAGAQGGDRANYLAQQQNFADRGATAQDVNQIYIELFGRPAEQAGIDYWMQSGETGEALRDAIAYSGFQGGTQDAASYASRQEQLAQGRTPSGYNVYTGEETGNGGNQGNQGGGSTVITGTPGGSTAARPVTPTVTIGQPGQGGGVAGGVYGSGMVSGTTPMINPYTINPYSSAGGLTPELLDAYRFQEFYNQGLVAPPIDRGIGSLSYFGIPPSQIQASLSGF